MTDNIRPIRVHPRTAEVMREIGMALVDMQPEIVIDENVPQDPNLMGIVMPDGCPVEQPRRAPWAWERFGDAGNLLSAKLQTDIGTARMHIELGKDSPAQVELDAWEQRFTCTIAYNLETDLMRQAELWANKILEKDPRQWVGGVEERPEDAAKRFAEQAVDLSAQLSHVRALYDSDRADYERTIESLKRELRVTRERDISLQRANHDLFRLASRQAKQIRKARKALKKENP